MEEEDFFKNYPAAEGAFEPNNAPPPADTNPFVLPEDELQPHQDDTPEANGSPPPTEPEHEECAAVTQWRIEFAKRLEDKLRHEREIKAERAQRAVHTLGVMHQRWQQSRDHAQETNQTQMREFVRQRDAVISVMSKKGELPNWNVVPQLVDMSGKFKEGARDTSRMRQVLLRMKTTE